MREIVPRSPWRPSVRSSADAYELNVAELSTVGAMHDPSLAWVQIPKLAMLSPEEIGAMGAFYDETRPCFHWSYHSPHLQVPTQCDLASCSRGHDGIVLSDLEVG